jgi:hypothetical protein
VVFRRGNLGRQKKRAGVRGVLPLLLLAIWVPGVIVAAHLIERSWSLDAAQTRTSPQEGDTTSGRQQADTTEARQQADTTEARQQAKPEAKRPRPGAAPTVATLNVVPTDPTFVCVDTGPGTQVVFAGTLESPRRFRARRVRLNMGKTSARLTANGKPVELEPSPEPVGYEVTPTKVQELELGQRPCA